MNSFEPAPGITILAEEFDEDETTEVIPKPTPLEMKMQAIREQLKFPLFIYAADPKDMFYSEVAEVFIMTVKK